MPSDSKVTLREDPHKKRFFFSGWTTKRGGGRVKPLSKKTFFFIKGQNLQKKYEPQRSKGGGGKPIP